MDRAAIDPRFFEKPYYLVPGKKAEKGYVLLREVLKKSDKVGIAKVVIRTRQYLAAVMPLEHALILNLMRFPQELVAPDEYTLPEASPAKYRISTKELEMATTLVDSMSVDWKPSDYKDDFRDKLRKIINEQVASQGKKRRPKSEEASPAANATTNVVDFMALLKKSLATKAGTKERGERHCKTA